ncbi:hypothetical protein GCM10022419_033440 [Nonomuraea rosea]|uniref:Uncharacterized protein n=1 Tax=Nonomuraea rosea TaxID=638574 RepID=A0ABP6WGX2_9ACTN
MRDLTPELAVAAACVIALAAVNVAYTIRRRRRQQTRLTRECSQLASTEQRIAREMRAAQRRTLDLTIAGEFAALGSNTVWRRFLDIHPELRAETGQKGGTA